MRPSLRFGVFIEPRHLERSFWSSDVCRYWSLQVDMWGIYCIIFNNVFFLVLQTLLPVGLVRSLSVAISMSTILAAIIQFCWLKYFEEHYSAWRRYVLICRRVARYVLCTALVVVTRWQPERDKMQQRCKEAASRFLSPSVVALRSLYQLSLAFQLFAQGIAVPLPFVFQLMVHALLWCTLVVYHLPSAVAILEVQTNSVFKHVCEWMNQVSVHTIMTVTASTPAILLAPEEVCATNGKPLLLLFLMTFMGVVLPVYFAYKLERHGKQLFLHRLWMQHQQHLSVSQAQATAQQSSITNTTNTTNAASTTCTNSTMVASTTGAVRLRGEHLSLAAELEPVGRDQTPTRVAQLGRVPGGGIDWEDNRHDGAFYISWEAPVLGVHLQDVLMLLHAAILTWVGVSWGVDGLLAMGKPL